LALCPIKNLIKIPNRGDPAPKRGAGGGLGAAEKTSFLGLHAGEYPGEVFFSAQLK